MPNRALAEIAVGARDVARPSPAAAQRRGVFPHELADMCGVHKSSIYRWLGRGVVKAEKRLGVMVIPLAKARRFLAEGPPRP